jgi:hypothetical protein
MIAAIRHRNRNGTADFRSGVVVTVMVGGAVF